MDGTEDRLHEIDLHQVERIRKLSVRLNRDLALLDQFTGAMALQEGRKDFEELGVEWTGEDADAAPQPSPDQMIAKLRADQTRILQALKKAVWDAGRTLVGDSKRWKATAEEVSDGDAGA